MDELRPCVRPEAGRVLVREGVPGLIACLRGGMTGYFVSVA